MGEADILKDTNTGWGKIVADTAIEAATKREGGYAEIIPAELAELNEKEVFTVKELCRWLFLTGRAKTPPHPEGLRSKLRAGKIEVAGRCGRGQSGGYLVSREVAEGITVRGRGRPPKGDS